MRAHRITSIIIPLAIMGAAFVVMALSGTYLYLDPQIPKADSYRHVKLETPLRIYTKDNQLMAEFGERRLIPVKLEEVPKEFISAILDTEDKRFYQHSGIDYISLLNDSLELLQAREIRSGASTITMQLARNISFSLEQTFIRKFKEMLLALKIEQELTKDEILELYINVVPFGKRAYGAQAAALTYYGKPLKDLDLSQLAMLAGIPQAPSAGNPINGPQRALRRRNLVLNRMLEQTSISEKEYDEASQKPISAKLHARELDIAAPFPAEWARSQLIEKFPDLYTGGYKVFTTLDSRLQEQATKALRSGILKYDQRHGYRGHEKTVPFTLDVQNLGEKELSDEVINLLSTERTIGGLLPALVVASTPHSAILITKNGQHVVLELDNISWASPYLDVDTKGPKPTAVSALMQPGDIVRIQPTKAGWQLAQLPRVQGALVSIDSKTGGILAIEGGFDFRMNQYNHATQAARQPGSGFKPFVYSAALASGLTAATVFMDAPLVFDDENLEAQYRPDNDNKKYNGPTRLREALYRSINLVSMRVLMDISPSKALNYIKQFGFNTETFPLNTQLAIGGGTMAVTPTQMASAYAVFANGGYQVEPHLINRVLDINDLEVFSPSHPIVCPKKICAESILTPTTERRKMLSQDSDNEIPQSSQEEMIKIAPRVIDNRNAYVMHKMLQDVIRKGTGLRARVLRRSDLAGKTGTTNNAADTWFNGYSPEIATTVWVGFPDHQPLGEREYGSNTPLPIWIDYMREALKDLPEIEPEQPKGIITMKIDPDSGKLAQPGQENAILEYFLEENLPERSTNRVINPDRNQIAPVDLF